MLEPGALTTVQDWPGRLGYWQVGVPPSGPMDEVSLREANLAVGNPEGAPALECTATGPSLRFSHDTVVCLGGAVSAASLDCPGSPDAPARALVGTVHRAGRRDPGDRRDRRARAALLPGRARRLRRAIATWAARRRSRSGRFGGHGGRALAAGDVLRAREVSARRARFR